MNSYSIQNNRVKVVEKLFFKKTFLVLHSVKSALLWLKDHKKSLILAIKGDRFAFAKAYAP